MLITVVLIVLLLLMVGALPQSGLHPCGYWPSGSLGVVLLVLVILLLLGRI